MKYIFLSVVSLCITALLLGRKKKRTQLCLFTIINNFKIKIHSMQLNKQEFVSTILGLIDKVTGEEIPATFDNVVLTSSDPSIFTADTDVDADSKIDVVGISPGEATLNVKAEATYKNSLGEEVTTPEEVNVTATVPPLQANETELTVKFTDPKPVPQT